MLRKDRRATLDRILDVLLEDNHYWQRRTTPSMGFVNLRDERYFPLAHSIPHHADTTTDLFVPSPNTIQTEKELPKAVPEPPTRRLRHWCLFAGLNCGIAKPGVQDVLAGEMDFGLAEAGREMELVHIRSTGLINDPDGGWETFEALRRYSPGGSIAVMYTVDLLDAEESAMTLREQSILHIPNSASTMIFKWDIDRIFEINDAFHARVNAGKLGHCQRCNRPASNHCGKCKSAYCGADCQKRDWTRHKDECQIVTQIRDWSTFDWDVYEEPYVFKKDKVTKPASSS